MLVASSYTNGYSAQLRFVAVIEGRYRILSETPERHRRPSNCKPLIHPKHRSMFPYLFKKNWRLSALGLILWNQLHTANINPGVNTRFLWTWSWSWQTPALARHITCQMFQVSPAGSMPEETAHMSLVRGFQVSRLAEAKEGSKV